MIFFKSGFITIKRFLVFLLIGLLVSCQTGIFNYKGKTVPPDRRIDIKEGGSQQGSWQEQGFSVNYRYSLDKGDVSGHGIVELNGWVNYSFSRVKTLHIWVNYLDDGGKIIERKSIYSTTYYSTSLTSVKRSFEHRLEIPPGTSYLAFSSFYERVPGRR